MDIKEIENESVESLSRLNMYELNALNIEVENLYKCAKAMKAKIAEALEFRFSNKINEDLAEAFKATGTVRFRDQGHEVIATIQKKVEWEANSMWEACKELGEDFVKAFVKMTYKIYERDWLKIRGNYRKILLPCRKVTEGKPLIKIENEGDYICG